MQAAGLADVQPDPLYDDIGGQNITINGYITVGSFGIDQDLIFDNNNNAYDFTVEDTLVIYGDVTFNVNSMNLIVNGFLIIFGDVLFRNRVDVEANGQIIVDGTATFQGGQGSFEGDGSVYANQIFDPTGGEGRVPADSEKSIFPDLQDDFPDIYEFVDGGGQTPLPVEILYFTAKKKMEAST
jgi:hypothetical protein